SGGKRKGTTKKKEVTQEKASGTVNEESAACGQQVELRCEDDRAAPSSAEERGVAGSRSESEGGDGAHKLSPGVKDCFLTLAQNILPCCFSTAGSSCDDDEDDDDDVAQPSAPEDTTSDQHRGAGEGPGQGDATLHSHGGAHGPNHKASTSGEQRQEADPERQQATVTEQGGAGVGGQEHLPHSEGCGTPGLKASLGLEGTETQGGGVAGSPQGGPACLLGSAEAVFTEGGKQSAKPKHVETYPETQAETSTNLQGKGLAEPCNEAGAQPAPPHSHCGTPGEPPALPAAAAAASVPEREESTRLCKGVIPRQGRGVAMEKGSQVFPNPGSGTTPPPHASAASWPPRSCAGRSRIRLGNEDAESAAGRKIQDSEEAGPEMNEKDFMRKTQQSHSQSRTETEELKASQSFGEGEGSDWGQIKLSENNKLSTSSSSAAAVAAESKPAAVYVNPCVLEERDWQSRFAMLEMEDSSDAGARQRKAKGAARSRRCKPATSAAAAGKMEVTTALVCAETACPDLTHIKAEGSLQGAAGAGGLTNPASAAQDREEGGPHPFTPAAARASPESEREDAGATQSCEDHSEWDSEFLHDCSTQRFPDSCSLPAPLPILGTESGGSALELPLSIGSISDSHLHEITLGRPRSQSLQDYEDASELVCGLIEELSQINRLIMLTYRELQSGRNPAGPGWAGGELLAHTANPKDL
ncbi:hypothetical protein HHUSO_G33771, partial [Huso huso]